MKQMTKIIAVILLISFQNSFGQNTKTQIPETNVFPAIANSEFDLIIRIDTDMVEEEVQSRIGVLKSFDKDLEIFYSRDETGDIKTLTSSGGKSSGSCKSDDFGYLIIALKDYQWKGCMISDKK
ncbi:hypothetical protein [Maribacter sp. HTCC2170]|uniref:hypothetical protein n=1 Tax=Maribacter sp. (strain HTCC2170 / KCCM 42371) TaxID=313603 RepID=UPI00006BD509|nr:hypothetical protein [Maribacter sp. HTCC2170]EAR02997.1 hypothetical protein FB2170_06900 [Maribacter sp. HTCC2170]